MLIPNEILREILLLCVDYSSFSAARASVSILRSVSRLWHTVATSIIAYVSQILTIDLMTPLTLIPFNRSLKSFPTNYYFWRDYCTECTNFPFYDFRSIISGKIYTDLITRTECDYLVVLRHNTIDLYHKTLDKSIGSYDVSFLGPLFSVGILRSTSLGVLISFWCSISQCLVLLPSHSAVITEKNVIYSTIENIKALHERRLTARGMIISIAGDWMTYECSNMYYYENIVTHRQYDAVIIDTLMYGGCYLHMNEERLYDLYSIETNECIFGNAKTINDFRIDDVLVADNLIYHLRSRSIIATIPTAAQCILSLYKDGLRYYLIYKEY